MGDCSLSIPDRNGIRKGDYVETHGSGRGGMLAAGVRGVVTGVHLNPYTRACVATIEPDNMSAHNQGDFESIVWPVYDLSVIDKGRSFDILSSRMMEIERQLKIKVS